MTQEDAQFLDRESDAIGNLRSLANVCVTATSLQSCAALIKIILSELAAPAHAISGAEQDLSGWHIALMQEMLTSVIGEQRALAWDLRHKIEPRREPDEDCFRIAAAGELLGLSDDRTFDELTSYLAEKRFIDAWSDLIRKADNKGEQKNRRLRASIWLGSSSAKTGDRRQDVCLRALLAAVKVYLARSETHEKLTSKYARHWTAQPVPVQSSPPEAPALAPPPAASPSNSARSSGWSRNRLVTTAVIVVLVVGLSVFVGKLVADSARSGTGSETPGLGDDSVVLPASTQYEVAYTYGAGALTNAGPSRDSVTGAALPEGEDLTIVCQERNGEVMTAEEFADGDVSPRYDEDWPVWNKLDNGYWIPDIFVNTPKVPGDEPPEGIALCED